MLKMLMKRFPSVGNAIYQLQLLSRVVLAVAMVAEDQGQTDGNASFLRAARAGNFEKVLEYLKGSIDINTSNANGLNALHLASKEGHVNIVSELLKRGANVNAATKKGNTALHIASLAGQEAVVKILVQSGANVNVQSQNGFTPLYMAAQENHDNVVCFLLANGANQSLATEDGFTPLAVALQQGHDKVVAVLLENDAKGRVRLPALHIAAKKDDCKAAALLLQNDHNPDITSKSGFTPLHIAAHYGNDSIGRLLLEKGAEINYAAKHQITPLHVASKWGKANMATLLLDKGAKIDASTRDGLTPLHCAARSGHDHVVDLLLERGAPITAKTKNGLAPLHMASQGDHVDGARILLYHKAPVDDVTVDYLTALHVAAHCGHVRVAKLLLDRKADPNARALNGFTPLHIACKKNRIKVVELLLKHGASIEARTESGLTPLHVAAFMGNMNIVIFLIQHGADPDIPTVRGETPIHLAARANQADIIRILLRNGARVDAKAREHQTPLHIAARLGNVDIVSLLIQHGAAVDATTKDMYTALHIASKEGQEEVASVLLDNGASLTATTKKGFTPLHLAAKYGNIKVARLLLQKDAPVDAQGKNGVTPLHVAAHYDHVNVALLLLDKGASPHATAKNGYTPLHIAAKKSQMDIATTLLEYGAKANSESKAGFTPLHLAAQEGHTDMTTLLIEHRADVNMKAKNGLTPLHLCAQEDHVNVAAILVKNDAENDPETNAGYTPLHVACHFGQVNMVRFLLQHTANVNSVTSHGYTPLHQAAQQGHTLIISLLLENKASPNALTNQGQTALSIARRLGYISVVETLKVVTETTTITTTTTVVEEKYKVLAPETMQETFMSDSEDEGGDEIEDTALFGKPTHATHVYLPYYEGQKLQTREDTILGDQSMRYLTVDEMKSLGDDSLPIDVTKDERTAESMLLSADSGAPLTVEEDHLSPLHIRHDIESVFVSNYAADNVDISRAPVHAGKLKWKTFLVSFMVDARGGAMRGCRHSGVRVIIPPRKAPMPMRITCRYLRKEKLTHPPPLMEGEACASRILEIGPVGAKFLGPVIIEVPHFASLRGKEREITILRSDNGEAWREHTLEATEEAVQDVLNESFEGEELNALQDLNTSRITQILTTDFPQYFAIITRVRQEVHAIGPEGGMVSSTVVPQVQAIFPEGALTKKIKVGLQTQPIPPELVSKLLGNRVGVSPIVTVEPRRRKFHKPITLTIPVPQAATKGMINQYSGDAPTLRLLCSITGSRMSGGVTKAQWEDVTGSTPLTFVNDCVSFTTTVSARFWLMDCRQVNEVTKYATELYREAVHVPFMAKFVVFAKHYEAMEAQLRVFCMTDDKEDKTLESQEKFSEIAKSRDVEVFEGKFQYLEFAGNLVPVTKSGEQLALNFQAFRENRLPFVVRVKDPHQESVGRIAFMREPKVGRGEPPQTPICNLNIVLPDICKVEIKSVPTELVRLEKKYGFVEETGLAKPELIHRADLRLSDIARGLDQDWVQLADQLDISESDVNNIKKEQPNDSVQQALVMLRLWLQQVNEDATGNNLEKALRKIGREDIVNSCMFNVEIVTDDVEKAVAKVHLDQSGFDAFKDELGSSRDASLRRDISLDVSYDEQDIMKEAESAEETSSEAGSLHEKKPFTPEERKQEEESLAIKHNTETEETDDGQTSTTTTETGEILVDDTTKHSIISVTKTTVDHELRDQMTKQAGLEEWSSNGMETSQLSFSGLPEDEQSELSTISTIITLEPEVGEKKTEVDFNAVEKAWAEKDESGAVQHTIQKEKQSTFTVKDGQSESHPGTETPDSTVHQPQAASDTERESSHIEPAFPCTEHKHFSHEDKESPLSRPSPPETASYCAEREISPAADYTVYLVPEMQVHVGVSPTESKPATSERDKDEEKHIKKLEGDFCSKLVSEPLSETVKKPLTTSSPKKTYSEIQRTEYVYGSKGLKSSDDIEDVSSKTYQVQTWTETAGTHLSEISQGSELDIAFYETPVGYENTAFAGVDVIDEPALEEQDSGRATSPYEVLRPSTPTLPTGQDKTVNMDQEIFSQFSKRNIDTSKNDTKTHVEHHIKSQIFNEELDLSIEENTPEKKDILEEKSMRQTEVDRNMIVAQQIRSEIFAHELAEDIESDLPEGKDIPHDRENAENMRKIKIGAYEEKEEIMDQIISRYDMNIAQPNDKQVYENEFSEENISFIEKSEWEQKSKVVAVEHVMWETSVQQGSEEIIEEVVKELPREKQIIVEHEENESLEDSIDEENRDDEVIFSLRKEATKVAQDIIEDIKTEVSRCHTLEHSLSEISDEDLVEKSEEYMLSHQEVENLLKTRDKPEEKRVSFSEDIPEIPQITTEEIETLECDQIHTEEEECKSELEHYAHFKEIVLSSEQKVHQKETVKGEDSYIESKSSNGIKCEKEKEKYTIEAPKLPNELQKTLAQATGEKTDNFSQCLSSFEETRSDDKVVTFTNTEKETKEEIANIMTSEITLFEKVTEELKEKESDLLSTHAEDDEKMYKESIVEKLQKQDYMSSTPVILYEKQEEKTPSEEQLEFSSISTYTHVEKCISDDFIKTEKDKEIFDINLTPGENMQILERKHEFSQQPGGEYFDVNKETSVKKSELSENTTYRDIQSFTQQKESIILDSSEELTKSLYECDQLMKDEKKTTSGQKSTIHYKSEDSSFESVDLQEKAVIRDQTISEATVKSDDEKKNEYDKLEKFTSGRTTDLSELSNSTRKEKQINREGETYSSSGETDSHYYSFEMSDSGRTPRETPATSRPCSSEFDINISAPISSEYETCATSQEASGDISGSYSTAYTSQEISFATAHSSLSHSSQESAVSVDSESSGHLASVEISSEASETLVPSAQEIEQEFGRDVETPTPDGDEMAQAFIVREPYDSEIPEEVIRGGVEVPFLSDWKTKESFEASYQQSSGVIFSKWSNISELCEIPSSPFEIITEEDLADYPGDYVEHISESKCLDTYKTEESKLKDIHKLDKNSKEIKSHESILEHTTTDVVVVNETVQRTVGSEGQRSIYDEQTPILDGQLFSDEHALRSSIYRQESGAYLAAESVDDLTDQMSCSQEELSASESSVTHSEQTWLSSSVETTILATEQQVWPCSGAVSQDQQVTETMHIFTEQQFSTPELPDVVSEQPPEHSPHPSDLMLYPQLNGPVEVDYVPEYDATYPESQEQETEVESTFAEGTSTFAVTGESNSSDTQDTSEQTSLVETTRNVLLSGTEISAFLPSQIHQPESERVYAESQELQPPAVSLGHTVSEQYSESDSSEGDIQDIQTIQEIQELQEQEYGQEYETCRAEADEVYFQYYQRQYEENEEETQNFPCEVDKTVDWPESELLEEFYKSDKIAEVSDDQVDSEIKSVLSHAVESEQQKDLEDIERPMSPEPPYYSSLGEDDSYLPESDQGSAFLQKNISSAQETSLSHTSTTSTTQFAATEITSESISTDQQLVTCTESFSKQFQTDSHTSESFEIMDKNEVVDTKPEEDTYDIIFENQIQAVSSIEKSSSSKIQQGDIMEESLLSKAQKSCGQQCLTESHIATAVAEKFTIQAHQAYKHDIELDSDFQSKNMMEEDKDDKSSGEKVKYTCGIQFEIKKQHDLEEDSFGELYTHREEDEDGLEEIERASKTKPSFCEEINSSDLGVFADRKYTSKSEQDDKSVLSLQEFEKLELDVTIGQKSSLGLGDLVFDKTVLSKSEEVDDISLCSQTEFEQLEKECEEVGHEPTKEDFSKPFEIKESYHVQEITEDAASSESDDYEKRMSEIDEIIRQAQTNVEQFHSDHDQSLSESTGFTVKLQKYTGALSSESTESSLMEKTSSQKDDHDIDSLNGNEILERQASVEGYILETNEESIIHELETRPALLHHITVGRTVSGHSAESCDSQPRSSTSTVTQYDIESLREREAELEETEAVGDLKSRFFTDQRVEKYKTLVEHKDFMHEESDHFFCEDSIYEKKEIHAEESSLLSDKSADVDSLLEERADKDSLQEERDVDQDSLHEEMDLPDDQEDVLPGAQKASKQVIIKSSWHQRHLSDDECDKDSLKDEYLAGQDTSSSGKDGKDSGGKGDCMISSTDSLEPSSSTATHATYQFETDSVMSSSVNSVHTSGEESTMVSSTDTIEPEVVLSYSVGDMTEAAESHLIFSRNQVESQLQLKSEIRSLVKDADKNYKTIISQSMTQPSQLVICLSEEGTKPHMSHDGEQMLGKDAEMLSAGELSENYEIEAKDESKNQVVIHPVEEYIVCPEKLDSTVSEADVKEQLKDFIEKQASGVTYSNEPQKDHSVDEKGNLYITKMVKQHLKSEPQVMNYLDEETPEPSVASYVKKSFEAEKNIAVIEELSERKEENEIMDARGNQVIIHHNKDDIHQANHNIADSERVVEKHVKDCIPKQTIDIDYGDDEVEGHHSVDEKENVVITKTVKDPLKYESQGPEDIIACHLVTHIDDKNLESGSTSDAVEAFETEKDVSITFKDKTRESVGEIKTTDVKRNISYKPTISNTDNIEERLKELLKKQTLGVGKDQEEVEEHQKVDEKGNVIITRTVKRHVTSEPQIHKKTFIGPDAEKQTKEFFQSFDSLKPTEDEDHYEGVDEEGNMIRVTQKFVVKPEIHTVTFTGPDAHKQMEYFMKTWNESQDDEKDSNDAYCHRVKVYTNDPSGEGEKTHSFEAEPQYTQSQPVYSCASSLSKMHESDGHQHISSDQTDQGLESDPVFHLKTQEPTSAAGQMLDSGTHQFHYRDVSDGVPLPASLTRHTVYPQDERTVQFDPRECDHEFHSKLLSHFISEEENKEFGSDDWQQDSGDGHWTDQSTTEVRLETTHTTTTVGAVTETTTQHSDINKQDSLQQSMQEILNQFMTDEGSSQTVYHFDNDKE
ncbi:uncharacterized protein LOC143252947 isoform X19 [Tachypleus tridentatus]|uniref:uncharacterized protein LOC143252947 isoform X19 n=1 Tax=Tachypleus tridentatus TaxID=6853 RepID=UPI003FD37B33